MNNVYNSAGQQLESLSREYSYNPTFMNPEDLKTLGLESGQEVEIRSAEGFVHALVESDPSLRSGVISMARAWGGVPSDDIHLRSIGSNTERFVSNAGRVDHRSGQPLMSAIPVNLRTLSSSEAEWLGLAAIRPGE